MDMSSFINQHNEAVDVVKQISALISGGTVEDAAEVRKLLSSLVGKLSIHLAMEDQSIYPKAKASDNAQLKAMAEKLETEMDGIAGALKDYSAKWILPAKINENQAEFISETNQLFEALGKRIAVEEGEFYPLCAENL